MYIKLYENDYYNILEIISTKKIIKITEEWSVIPLVEGLLLCMKAKFQSSASHKPCVHVCDSTIWEEEAGEWEAQGHIWIHGDMKATLDYVRPR